MAVKVLMTWDIAGERDQEYFEFIISEFVLVCSGNLPAEAWATIWFVSQIRLAACERAAQTLSSRLERWGLLQDKLFDYAKLLASGSPAAVQFDLERPYDLETQ
jgi:hypothetical protein